MTSVTGGKFLDAIVSDVGAGSILRQAVDQLSFDTDHRRALSKGSCCELIAASGRTVLSACEGIAAAYDQIR